MHIPFLGGPGSGVLMKVKALFSTLYREWSGKGQFLGRGNWSELMLSTSETFTGVHILLIGEWGVHSSMLLGRFDDALPIWVVGMGWLISGGLTLVGILLYSLGIRTSEGYRIEQEFRFVGALGSLFVWSCAGVLLFPSPFMYLYFAAAIGAMRVTRLIWRS